MPEEPLAEKQEGTQVPIEVFVNKAKQLFAGTIANAHEQIALLQATTDVLQEENARLKEENKNLSERFKLLSEELKAPREQKSNGDVVHMPGTKEKSK